MTAFLYCCQEGWAETAKELLSRGCDFHCSNENGSHAGHLCALSGSVACLEEAVGHVQAHHLSQWLSAPNRDGLAPCHIAAGKEFGAGLLSALAGHGADLNLSVRSSGRAPVHIAAERGHTDNIRTLFQRGFCNVELQDALGRTAFCLAALAGKKTAMACLALECHCDVDSPDHDGQTPLVAALARGGVDAAMVRFMVKECGCNPSACGHSISGETPLHTCLITGNLEALHLLILYGADIDAGDAMGVTPLLLAVRKSSLEAAEALVSAGADPDKPDRDGKTPRETAKLSGDSAMIEAIKKSSSFRQGAGAGTPQKKNYVRVDPTSPQSQSSPSAPSPRRESCKQS